jgi:peroxiredoxin Q/BCP
VERTTFLIDKDGRLVRVFEKVTPKGHADEVAAAIADR